MLAHLLIAFSLASLVYAHGAPEYPISRQYNCYKNPQLPACRAAVAGGLQQAIYDWNGVNQGAANGNHQAVVPDGALCGGGQSLFRGFDLPRADWPATAWAPAADGLYEFRYHATAPHATRYMRFYLTRPGFDATVLPLSWSDLDQVAEIPRSQIVTTADSRYVVRLSLPPRTGRHVVFMVWQRMDSQEAFYACSDVSFGVNPTPIPPTTLRHLGQLSANQDLPAGAKLNLRVFGAGGVDLETTSVTVTTPAASAWLTQLATEVNLRSRYLRLGSLESTAVVAQVYALATAPVVTYQLDTTLPAAPGARGTWTEGSTYTVGQMVTYQGTTYRCLQAHTAWRGANWFPSAPGVIDVLWKKV